MASEQFSLCWDNFHRNMSRGMQSLLENEDLVDVTLAIEGRYLKAHKMVLSVCSPYFRELFQGNPCKHPIVFMKDVSYVVLMDLLQFMYQGEVQVAQENLTLFIKTAEALQIKGLTGDNDGQSNTENEEMETVVSTASSSNTTDTKKTTPSRPPKKFSGPASKKPKLNPATPSPHLKPLPVLSTASKYEVTSVNTNSDVTDDLSGFKPEPDESAIEQQSDNDTMNDSQIDQYADYANAEDNADDGDDFSMTDEPKASTSTDMGGGGSDNQDYLIDDPTLTIKKPRSRTRTRFIHGGFVYHSKLIAGKSNRIRYLACAEIKRSGCRARAILPVGMSSSFLRITHPHNHPPNENVEEKDCFVTHLKQAARTMPGSLRRVYETIAILYPRGAEELPFKSICSSLHRWRRDLTL